MRSSLTYFTLIAVVPAACGGHSTQPAPISLEPCAISGVGTQDSVWHQVRASGFTFCVPPSWGPAEHPSDDVDAKEWHGHGGSLVWDLGHPHSFIGRDVRVTVTGSVVVGMNPRPIPQESHVCSPQKTTPRETQGVSLLVVEVECQRQWTITAWSTSPAIYIQTEAFEERVADLLRRALETIHFTSSK